jgi:glucokinase
MILAGEIAGGWIHLALFRPAAPEPHLLRAASLPSGEHAGLRPVVRRFAAEDLPSLRAACLVVPGPVVEGHCAAPGLPWPVSAAELADALGLPEAELIDGSLERTTLQDAARRAALKHR